VPQGEETRHAPATFKLDPMKTQIDLATVASIASPTMKSYFQTLSPQAIGSMIEVDSDFSDCIEIVNSEALFMPALIIALKGNAKHGSIGEALPYLFEIENDGGTALMMKDARPNADWLKAYSSVYWFVCGYSERDFAITSKP
jgi:hypothetical protein